MENKNNVGIINLIKNRPLSILVMLLIVAIIILGIYSTFFKGKRSVKVDDTNKNITDEVDLLSLGEEKYLEFLWMVDGAFNDQRYNNEISVNGKVLEIKLDFTCVYDEEKKTCQGINFEKNYKDIFASNIEIDSVYGDGVAVRWYEKKDNEYYFENSNSCNIGRMSLKQNLKLISNNDNKLVYQVTYDEEISGGIYKGDHHFEKDFVLIYENGKWKVSEAYYHDPCYMEYIIK